MMINDFKFFHKNIRTIGELNPNYEPNLYGISNNQKYLWMWSDSNDGIESYDFENETIHRYQYEFFFTNWDKFISEHHNKIIYVRYIIDENGRLIEDGIPHQWNINLSTDILYIKAVILN